MNLLKLKSETILGQCGATFNPSTTPFVTTWTVQQGDLDIEIYTINAYDYDFTVDWGDGQSDQNVSTDITHTYSNAGTYTVSITGVFPYFKTCKISTGPTFFGVDCDNATKLSSVESWGNQEWRLMDGSFNTAENFNVNTLQAPDLSFVTSLKDTFKDAESFNQNIDGWDVSNVSDLSNMLENASSFNQPLNSWDVSNVTDMSSIFSGADSFNQLINNWNVSNVTNMRNMFSGASSFNQNLNDWDVSNVTNMRFMFSASQFNQPLNNWDVSNVTDMGFMFDNVSSFNQPLNNWDVSNVTDMRFMFNVASSFNQPIDNWDVSSVTNMVSMFNNAVSFNQDISDWCVEQIPTAPNDFAINSALQASFFPDWGATCTLSIAENSLDNFKVYPNPVEGQLNLFWSSVNFPDEMNIQIYNLSGKKVFEQSYDQKPSELDVSPLSSGVYLLKVISGEQSTVRRIIKK